nr:pentatricopeptide repeat-containing protein At1g31790 [Tanacetum cinerariifolium]
MILQTKLTTLNLISTSLNPQNPNPISHLPAKITTINLPLHKPRHKPLKPIKTHKPKPITTTTPSDILRLLDTLRFPIPDAVYISLIKECTQFECSNEAVIVHSHMTKTRKKRLSLTLINRVLIMYVSCWSLDNARKVFDEMSKKDFNSWAIMIAGYADNGEYEEVIRLFVNDKFRYIMYSCRSFPVSWIMVCVLKACGETINVELGEQVHGWLMKSGYSDDLFVGSSLISFYGKIGCFEDGDMVFHRIGSRRNVVVWTARIINNCKEERFREVFEVFNEMGKEGVRKNSFTLSSVLSACSKISDDGNCGEQVHANAIKLGLASKSYVQCGLVNMYGKFGLISDAKRVFIMNESRRNRACWNAMLTSLVQNGCLVEAIKFLYQMRAAGVQPQELWLNKLRSLCGSEVIEIK